MTLADLLFTPFIDHGFMRRALAACAALAVGGAPLGAFLALRRMALMGDALSHAILPGVAVAFLFFGAAPLPMMLGGLAAGLLVALAAGGIARVTPMKEDASFTALFLISLATGALILSLRGGDVDLEHVLFGDAQAVDNASLLRMTSIVSLSTLALAAIYRGLIVECFDPGFMRSVSGRGALTHQLFLALVVMNLVAAFQALGAMMGLGLMLLPAIAARFWCRDIDRLIALSVVIALVCAYAGLLISFHAGLPSGPAIVLTAGAVYIASLGFGRYGSLAARLFPQPHLA